ncbi:right-handed parallel beta-helix repeat-containing protein [Bifidobacterium vespertilionis]|uniref:right-handed parallel beta-helix repeat-containing protein n=1 Tax=Bifidobacterium vespertilionis TaxID=2562524 RepID=UPI001BDC2E21|nr:right-handed parallel beta-helix repeat-containing protein [Bifidobacterium vespertilionis]MBT1179826.1 right-handed parallel beta-helix repeat-containing protein [Bifidobacterium vespertilionis]
MTTYHVARQSDIAGEGTVAAPFRTINEAAAIARPGDEIIVHDGIYRERVNPQYGGEEGRPIVYRAADGERPLITGSERVRDWIAEGDGVWRAELPNAMFGAFNPYARTVYGDWVVDASSHARAVRVGDDALSPEAAADAYPERPACHLGQVYLNGHALYEAFSLAEVRHPMPRTVGFDSGLGANGAVADPPKATTLVWYAQVSGDRADGTTTIWANFGGADPNVEEVEANVRESCFYPSRPQINHITVRGFELARAASPWAPPTGDQIGLIGTHWSRGWIIEDNDIHDAKCSAVSLGKEGSTGDNDSTRTRRKSGYQYQMEAVFKALRFGWARGVVGGHIVRNNVIHDCGQNGVVGHMGCAFGVIKGNEIYNIATRREFWGHEIGGIKLHAAVDTVIRTNNVHDCTLGVWLDWQTQGTHIDRNVFWDNSRDVMVEVSHGPYTVSDNVFASPIALDVFSDGGAFVNNLIGGKLRLVRVLDRSTPYHFPHTTEVAGSAFVYGGDDRFINNVFVKPAGSAPDSDEQKHWHVEGHGTRVYNLQAKRDMPRCSGEHGERPVNVEGYERLVREFVDSSGDEERFRDVPQPVLARDNTYLGGARPLLGETGAMTLDGPARVEVTGRGDADSERHVTLTLRTDDSATGSTTGATGDPSFPLGAGRVVSTADLGTPRVVEERFEKPDGSPFTFDADIMGAARGEHSARGPLADLRPGVEAVVWSRA